MIAPFMILQSVFEFPDILRKPASEVFEQYLRQQSIITPTYYFFMLSELILIPLSITMHHIMKSSSESNNLLLSISTGFGIGAGIAQIFGFIRWPFLMPYLAETYASSASTPATKETVAVVYESFNRYAGMAVGEHLGWVLLGLWLIGVSMVQLKLTIFKSWVGILGLLSGAGLLVSAFEQLSGSLASVFASLNIVANYLLLGWLLGTASFLFIEEANKFEYRIQSRECYGLDKSWEHYRPEHQLLAKCFMARETELRTEIVVAPFYLYAEIPGRAERQSERHHTARLEIGEAGVALDASLLPA